MTKLKTNRAKIKSILSCGMFTVARKQEMYTFTSLLYFTDTTVHGRLKLRHSLKASSEQGLTNSS